MNKRKKIVLILLAGVLTVVSIAGVIYVLNTKPKVSSKNKGPNFSVMVANTKEREVQDLQNQTKKVSLLDTEALAAAKKAKETSSPPALASNLPVLENSKHAIPVLSKNGRSEQVRPFLDNKPASDGVFKEATKALEDSEKYSSSAEYLPYVQVGGARFFNTRSFDSSALGIDLFLPIWQTPTQLVFTDVSFYDRTGKPFEGNVHLGYRHLLPEKQQLYGIYAAFDRKRTQRGNYFNQLTFGAECWLDKIFLGGNFYQPIGNKSKLSSIDSGGIYNQEWNNFMLTKNKKYENVMQGVDAEIGYEFIKGLVGYVGGYYFRAQDVATVYGPKAELTCDLSLDNGKRVLWVFDKVGLEVGVQHDKVRGTTTYFSVNFKVGLSRDKQSNLQGVARHMIDLVRRDVDVVVGEAVKKETKIYKEGGVEMKMVHARDLEKLLWLLKNSKAPKISVEFSITKNDEERIKDALKDPTNKELVFGDFIYLSDEGRVVPVRLGSAKSVMGSVQSEMKAVFKDAYERKTIIINEADLDDAVSRYRDVGPKLNEGNISPITKDGPLNKPNLQVEAGKGSLGDPVSSPKKDQIEEAKQEIEQLKRDVEEKCKALLSGKDIFEMKDEDLTKCKEAIEKAKKAIAIAQGKFSSGDELWGKGYGPINDHITKLGENIDAIVHKIPLEDIEKLFGDTFFATFGLPVSEAIGLTQVMADEYNKYAINKRKETKLKTENWWHDKAILEEIYSFTLQEKLAQRKKAEDARNRKRP